MLHSPPSTAPTATPTDRDADRSMKLRFGCMASLQGQQQKYHESQTDLQQSPIEIWTCHCGVFTCGVSLSDRCHGTIRGVQTIQYKQYKAARRPVKPRGLRHVMLIPPTAAKTSEVRPVEACKDLRSVFVLVVMARAAQGQPLQDWESSPVATQRPTGPSRR